MSKEKTETPKLAKANPATVQQPARAPRKSAKVADLEALEQKLMEANVKIADIGKIADQVLEIFAGDTPNIGPPQIDDALVKIEAILALVRGEDLGEWARARIGL